MKAALRPAAAQAEQRDRGPLGFRVKAGEGIRTLDIQLGKLTLYQLSYTRNGEESI